MGPVRSYHHGFRPAFGFGATRPRPFTDKEAERQRNRGPAVAMAVGKARADCRPIGDTVGADRNFTDPEAYVARAPSRVDAAQIAQQSALDARSRLQICLAGIEHQTISNSRLADFGSSSLALAYRPGNPAADDSWQKMELLHAKSIGPRYFFGFTLGGPSGDPSRT